MKVLKGSAAAVGALVRPVVTVGNFDGIHRGHRSILDTVRARARALGGVGVAYTFDPHPRRVLQPANAPKLLTTLEQRLELLEQAGVDVVVVERFTREFASTSAEAFIREVIHARIRPVEVYVGYDFHFGRDREGSMRLLTELGPRLGFSVTIIPEVQVGGSDVSSTRIRELLGAARVEEANAMLGRAYSVRGRVARGDARGRTLGFPTANLEPENEVLPGAGVYAGRLRLLDAGSPPAGAGFGAVTTVGTRPTFRSGSELLAEAHLLGFSGDLYGRRVELSFEARLRAERRFPSADALREQIRADVAAAREHLEQP